MECAVTTLVKKYFRPKSNKPGIWEAFERELPAAIFIVHARLMETTPDENQKLLSECLKNYQENSRNQ